MHQSTAVRSHWLYVEFVAAVPRQGGNAMAMPWQENYLFMDHFMTFNGIGNLRSVNYSVMDHFMTFYGIGNLRSVYYLVMDHFMTFYGIGNLRSVNYVFERPFLWLYIYIYIYMYICIYLCIYALLRSSRLPQAVFFSAKQIVLKIIGHVFALLRSSRLPQALFFRLRRRYRIFGLCQFWKLSELMEFQYL